MKIAFFILLLFGSAPVLAQEVPVTTEQQLENLSEEAIDDDALLQQLAFYQKHPLNLNTASSEELYLLRLLTSLQIQNLLHYRTVFGNLLSIYELQAVPTFNLVTIHKILPFVFVGEASANNKSLLLRLQEGNMYVLNRFSRVLERSRGYDTTLRTHYLGDRNHLQARLIYQYKNLLYYGVVADKDAGEKFFKGTQKAGFDFYSFHFFLRDIGRVKALALGDYALNLGQGLIQWHSLAFGKSAEVLNIKRQAAVLLPYRSAGEFFYNRGAAATVQAGPLQATAFVSYKSFSGNIATDSIERFTSFGTAGYHRTRLEVEDRYRIKHFSAGGNLTYNRNNFSVGVNAITHRFSLPLQKQDAPFNQFSLAGKSFSLASIDYSYTYRNAHFFGEVASGSKLHPAIIQGALISMDAHVDLSFLYRRIPKEFQSPFGNAFSESNLPSNENGFFIGTQIRPLNGWQLSAYADMYRFPFLKYRVSAPTRGWDYLAQVMYVPGKRTEIYLRYRTESKPINGTGQVINVPVDQRRKNLRFHFITTLNQKLVLKGRTEMTWFYKDNAEPEEGFLTYVEAAYEPWAKLKGNIRLQYFETGGYDSRIYAYESDVLYSYSIPGFFYKGVRYYLNLHYNVAKQLTFWGRIAQTVYRDKNSIGSGLDEIKGNHRTDVRLQIRYSFN